MGDSTVICETDANTTRTGTGEFGVFSSNDKCINTECMISSINNSTGKGRKSFG